MRFPSIHLNRKNEEEPQLLPHPPVQQPSTWSLRQCLLFHTADCCDASTIGGRRTGGEGGKEMPRQEKRSRVAKPGVAKREGHSRISHEHGWRRCFQQQAE